MTAYYNEIDPYAAQWLRNLIAAGHIAPGVVDTRSILDVSPDDLAEFTQCHFFAGIGVWSYALRRGGWLDSSSVWTGSCPCQPFSVAGMGAGFDDERHLWPFWFHLIEQRRPPVVFGEQVEAAIRHGWFDLVQADLEGIGYALAAAGIPAASVGAPHIRQRLFFVADAMQPGWPERRTLAGNRQATRWCGESRRLDDADDPRLEGLGHGHQAKGGRLGALGSAAATGESCWLDDAHLQRLPTTGNGTGPEIGGWSSKAGGVDDAERQRCNAGRGRYPSHNVGQFTGPVGEGSARPGPVNGFWRNADWLLCRDGRWRPVEPSTFPLAHGASARVGRLRAYGNAICAPLAAEFISAFLECRP